jgi:hypothetical protein
MNINQCLSLCLCLCCHTALLPAAEPSAPDPFAGAPYRLRHARTGRVSSWDRTGDNRDFISFQPGETKDCCPSMDRARSPIFT